MTSQQEAGSQQYVAASRDELLSAIARILFDKMREDDDDVDDGVLLSPLMFFIVIESSTIFAETILSRE